MRRSLNLLTTQHSLLCFSAINPVPLSTELVNKRSDRDSAKVEKLCSSNQFTVRWYDYVNKCLVTVKSTD